MPQKEKRGPKREKRPKKRQKRPKKGKTCPKMENMSQKGKTCPKKADKKVSTKGFAIPVKSPRKTPSEVVII